MIRPEAWVKRCDGAGHVENREGTPLRGVSSRELAARPRTSRLSIGRADRTGRLVMTVRSSRYDANLAAASPAAECRRGTEPW